MAQYADACNLFAFMGNDAMARKLDVLKGHCDAVGRDYETIERTILTTANLSAGDDALSRMVKKLSSTRENDLRGHAIVVVDDAAQHWPSLHRAFTLFRQSDDRRLLTDSLMRSTCVVELDVFGQH